jgi:hypothetical protein
MTDDCAGNSDSGRALGGESVPLVEDEARACTPEEIRACADEIRSGLLDSSFGPKPADWDGDDHAWTQLCLDVRRYVESVNDETVIWNANDFNELIDAMAERAADVKAGVKDQRRVDRLFTKLWRFSGDESKPLYMRCQAINFAHDSCLLVTSRNDDDLLVKLEKQPPGDAYYRVLVDDFNALMRYYKERRLKRELLRVPPWVDMKAIRYIESEARRIARETGIEMHVDHIIPRNHPRVCGLHWHGNLEVIARKDNERKGNRFNEGWFVHATQTWVPLSVQGPATNDECVSARL